MDDHIFDAPQKQCCICLDWFPETLQYFRPTRGTGKRSRFAPRCRACHNAIRNGHLVLIYQNGTDKYKPCSKCHQFVLRSDFFKDKYQSDGLCSSCKECQSRQQGVKHHLIKVMVSDDMKYCRKGENCLNPEGPILPATLEYFFKDSTNKSGLHAYCKMCNSARNKDYVNRNHLKVKEIGALYRVKNKDKILLRMREWGRLNIQKKLIHNQRRKARLNDLPDTFSDADWAYALNYWNGCCAVCSRPLNDLFGTHKAAMDHWIPLQSPDCPGTVAWNIVPLCHGVEGCNNRKRDINPVDWVLQTFGKSKGSQILTAIDKYFAIIKGGL